MFHSDSVTVGFTSIWNPSSSVGLSFLPSFLHALHDCIGMFNGGLNLFQDGEVVLATANYDRLSADVVQDIMEVIKDQALAEKPLTCSQFVELMLGAEVVLHTRQLLRP